MADGDSPGKDGGWVPVPDPTILTTEALLREIGNLREILTARMDADDVATRLRLDAFLKVPEEIAEQIAHLHDLMDEKFKGVQLQFAERDVRTESAQRAAKEALDAALQSAKELVGVTNDNVTKQIDQIATSSTTQNAAIDARITELKERIDRGGGIGEGALVQRTETRQQNAGVIAAIGLGFTLVIVVVAIFGLYLANR
jgi:hypothetical protein